MKRKSLLKKTFILFLSFVLAVPMISSCENEQEETTETQTTQKVTKDENYIPMVTAMGITVPQDLQDTWISLYDCIYFAGPYVSQDGSWEWISAEDTTPQRGDIVVYISNESPDMASHEAICVKSYDGSVYMNIDGNYGDEPGGLWKGRYDTGVPNKSWPDSYPKYPGTETAIGVYRTKNAEDAELMALAAESVYNEYKILGQDIFLQKYMPEFYYGVWCYYLIPMAVNAVGRHRVGIKEKQTVETDSETTSAEEKK